MNSNSVNTNPRLPVKQLYIFLAACALIILSSSIDVMIRVKDLDLFDQWRLASGIEADVNDLFNAYVTISMSIYFFKIIVPIIFGIYCFYAYKKIRVNHLFVFIWTVLNLGGLAYVLVERQLGSVFFYLSAVGYLINVIMLISLMDVIKLKNSK
ncbi:MAG: hypothetical protein BGO41_12685 [Clostridiales bacterium 38-18]|nr:MAG: hypothetical protein BGO41_12685 [Clostridiales bacterium 38-18]